MLIISTESTKIWSRGPHKRTPISLDNTVLFLVYLSHMNSELDDS